MCDFQTYISKIYVVKGFQILRGSLFYLSEQPHKVSGLSLIFQFTDMPSSDMSKCYKIRFYHTKIYGNLVVWSTYHISFVFVQLPN